MPILTGEGYYIFNSKTDDAFGQKNYKIALVVEGDELENAKKLGMKLRVDERGNVPGTHVLLRRGAVTKAGKDAGPPACFDAKKNPWPASLIIGNGSKVKVKFSVTPKGGFYWDSMQVVDYIPYENKNQFQEEEGVDVTTLVQDNEDFNSEPALETEEAPEVEPDEFD